MDKNRRYTSFLLWKIFPSGNRMAVKTPWDIVSMPKVRLFKTRGQGHPASSSAEFSQCP